jgi:hypothetical protein
MQIIFWFSNNKILKKTKKMGDGHVGQGNELVLSLVLDK